MYELEDIGQEQESFTIDSDSKADWACKIIKQEEQETERLIKTIDEEIEILKNKKERLQNQLEQKTGFLKSKLMDYFDTVQTKELKTCFKYRLPSADLVFMKPVIKYERDDEKILKYLLDNNKFEYIDVVHKLKWSELKKNEDIEHIDGITKIKIPMQFTIK